MLTLLSPGSRLQRAARAFGPRWPPHPSLFDPTEPLDGLTLPRPAFDARGPMDADLRPLYQAHVAHLTRKTTEALAAEGYDAIAIHSGALVKRSEFDDQYWPLRAVPHFQHWAHLEWPDCVLHLRAGRTARLLFARDRSFWERPREPDFALIGAGLELVEVRSADDIKAELLPLGRTAFVGDRTSRPAEWGLSREDVNPAALLERLDELRVFKTAYEIACLREANRLAARGHAAVRDRFLAGERSELALHLAYLGATLQDDPETPYKNIVALGESAAILHHVHYRRAPVAASSLLLDAGATHRGYASDITRTYVAEGGGAGRALFAELLAGMDAMQQAVCGRISVGRPYESLHDESHARLAEVLTGAGLVRMSAEACVTSGVTRKFLPHGLGHSLGLQTHDVGCARIKPRAENPFLRNTRVIEAGQVFTIEPGLYFIDSFMDELRGGPAAAQVDWKALDALRAFGGIRIEDDLLVLPRPGGQDEDGAGPVAAGATTENLTRAVL